MTDPGRAPVDKTAGVQPLPIAFAPILDTRRPIIGHCPYCHSPIFSDHDDCYDSTEDDPEEFLNILEEPETDDDCRS